MLTISEFRTLALKDLMLLERIMADIYTQLTADMTGFAMFDGGAHRGFHTKQMLALPGCRRVHAVEADPFMMETLRANLADALEQDTPELCLIGKALQDDPDTRSISWKSSHSHVGRSSIKSRNPARTTIWPESANVAYRDEMSVEATTIDLILADETAPLPFLKLDLEGADLLALQGAADTLQDRRPVVAEVSELFAGQRGLRLPRIASQCVETQFCNLFHKCSSQPPGYRRIAHDRWFGVF